MIKNHAQNINNNKKRQVKTLDERVGHLLRDPGAHGLASVGDVLGQQATAQHLLVLLRGVVSLECTLQIARQRGNITIER